MPDKPMIALEIHDRTLWEPSRVFPIVDTMEQWGYNTLVLHQNDLLDVCTQLFLSANYGVADLRLKKVRNNAAWLNRLVERLAEFDAQLFLEIKEPSFHDYALEDYPGLLGVDGRPDPMDPSWFDFCRDKTMDLLERVPGIGGFIVNVSSPESRVSIPDHLATTEASLNIGEWFDGMIEAFQQPLADAGKQLFVRDFSYTTDLQSEVLAAVDRTQGGVGASVKITAHDYFPEFPENPVARTVSNDLILEFEAFGEHTGWGVVPNCRVEELRQRMVGYREMGASGILVRTSWEAITGVNALDSLSAVNVYALPKLIVEDIDAEVLVSAWLLAKFGLHGSLSDSVASLLLESWQIPAGTYWNGEVFPRHSCLPSSWQEGWISMLTQGMGRRDQVLEISGDDPRLSDDARARLFKTKEATTALAERLANAARKLRPELPEALAQQFATFDHLPVFARQFELATKATFCVARGCEDDLKMLQVLHSELLKLADVMERELIARPAAPHHHLVLLSPAQVRLFARSLV